MNKIAQTTIENFIYFFRKEINKNKLDLVELTNDNIGEIITEFFNKKTLSEANSYRYHVLEKYINDPYDKIDWKIDRAELEKTQLYKEWDRYRKIERIWYEQCEDNCLEEKWVEINGKAHTNEEAVKIAVDKWCELLFDWHLQDNGALNENHPGGFTACALGTVLANKSKETITEDMKLKAYDLLKQYYERCIHFAETYDLDDVRWLDKTFPDPDGKFKWERGGFSYDLYCDYGPTMSLYLILLNAGIPGKDVDNICPWKTGISIRTIDNTVMYRTYQHMDEL